jgi:flagellar basal-body rod protein FlgF
MQTPSYVALSSQAALSRQMSVIANNLANASTPAYKGERVVFQEYLEPSGGSGGTAYVMDTNTYRDTREGPMSRTGNPLDVAIEGSGYMVVQTPQGNRYTRNGHLQLGADGTLVTADGYPILGAGGQPVTVPPGSANITITADGTLSARGGAAGRIELVDFPDEQQVEPAAGGLYVSSATPTPAVDAKLRQGMVEDSNVQPIVEMTRLMQVSRNYTATTNMINDENDRIKNALDKLSQTSNT